MKKKIAGILWVQMRRFLTDLAHDTVNFGLYDDVNIAEM